MRIISKTLNDQARKAGQPFYDAFLSPFIQADSWINLFAKKLSTLPDQELRNLCNVTGESSKGLPREEMLTLLIVDKNKEFLAIAADLFKDNVINADFKQPWLKELANNIFDEYIGDMIRTNGMTKKVSGIIRAATDRKL